MSLFADKDRLPAVAPGNAHSNRQTGFGLIELMIAMTLGLFLLGGVISLFVANREAYRSHENLAHMQDNARIAFELMARELRVAGGNPCGATQMVNVLNSPASDWWSNWDAGAIQGFEITADITPIVVTGTAAGQRVGHPDPQREQRQWGRHHRSQPELGPIQGQHQRPWSGGRRYRHGLRRWQRRHFPDHQRQQ